MKTILIYVAAWFGLVVLAIMNGTLREKGYGPYLTELSAHQLSTLLGIVLFGFYIWFLTGLWQLPSAAMALVVGGVWLLLTLLFEFGFGHYVMGHAWQTLLHDYNIIQGRVWILILIWTALAPYLFFRIRA
ncbi:MAG: hypothetical protein CSH49_13790 [Alcanivorax sp.]|nr:MAG: hypothetical protein CSH49_13790 [Alcanivorax sp.]